MKRKKLAKKMLYRCLYLLTVILKIIAIQQQAHFSRENTCPGKQVSSSKCTVHSNGRSKIHCGMLCSQADDCVSFKWDKNLQSCQTCREVKSSDCSNTVLDSAIAYHLPCENGGMWSPDGQSCSCPPSYSGVRCQTDGWYRQPCTTQYKFCSSNNLRGCYLGHCLCEIGYFYSVSNDTCIRTCGGNSLLGEFERYPGYFIHLHNHKCVANPHEESCMDQCRQSEAVLSCDFVMETEENMAKCCSKLVTWLDVESQFRKKSSNIIHLQKKCK